jgi:prolyl-tRNA editing enzyme YbaK/EbsC (Cys-tRNA(Pro) deacylase)
MSIEKVRKYFNRRGIDGRIQEFDVSSATVELAAIALNCEPKRIAKTLSFKLDGKCILIVVAGDAKIDNPKYKQNSAYLLDQIVKPDFRYLALKTEEYNRANP